MASVYTVKQVNTYIKNMFTQDYALNRMYVKGEVSNCKYHPTGHIYFTLKDESGVLSCIMFAGNRKGLTFPLKEGQKVIAGGNINVYERDGKYQLYAFEIHLDGAGDLHRRFEELKVKLADMGMFADEYKQPIPKYCKTIGIVTASSGAAIHDIINISSRRNPYVQLILYPALVQGDGAVNSIITGIQTLERKGVDCIIIGRGGGSMEDLWAFNEEEVARAIFECDIPIISAVGHETDVTIADYVADLRAPTPSAAAELAVFDYRLFLEQLMDREYTLTKILQSKIDQNKNRLDQAQMRLQLSHPKYKLLQEKQYLSDLQTRLAVVVVNRMNDYKHRLALMAERLNGLSPLDRLSGGYVFITDEKNKPIETINQLEVDKIVHIQLADGKADAKIMKKRGDYGKGTDN